jgi:cytochrome P450
MKIDVIMRTTEIWGYARPTPSWGSSAVAWDPARFIELDDSQSGKGVGAEQLRVLLDGIFSPWSHGERLCPGKRFSQAELAAVVVVLFRKHDVEAVPEIGEADLDARERAKIVLA